MLPALGGCADSEYRGAPRALVIAAGEVGGFYLDFARLLAAELNRAEPNLRCSAMETSASQDNLNRVRAGGADLGLVLADTALAASAGTAPFDQPVPLHALGRVYENYMQLVVRADSPVQAVEDLAGRLVSLGAQGSGAAVVGARMFELLGLAARVEHLSLADAVAALGAGRIDALLWSGGVPTPKLAELDEQVGIRLLPLGEASDRLRARYGAVYEQAPVPSGAYRLVREVPTVGVANLLVCAPTLPDEIAAAVVRVLVQQSARLVPDQALGTQFLDVRTLIGTAGLPLHPGAAAAYRRLHG
nr:TAXI family TRAP transporter solute-binding subunit [Solihabitans fulvus]